MLCRVCARVRVLFAVQRSGAFGAPEVVGSTNPSRSRTRRGVLVDRALPAPTRPPHPARRQAGARAQFAEPAGDRRGRDARGPRHQRQAAPAERARLRRRPYAARPLGQRRRQRPVLRSTPPEIHSFDSILRPLTFHHLLSYELLGPASRSGTSVFRKPPSIVPTAEVKLRGVSGRAWAVHEPLGTNASGSRARAARSPGAAAAHAAR